MAQKPRTPVHFPRMKVRGRRNRAKLAMRRKHRTVLPHVTMVRVSANKTRFDAIAKWEPGCFRLEIDRVTDGWGRAIERERIYLSPAPRPAPTFSMQFKLENPMSDELRALLYGEASDGEG